jgi:hypothetical protein
MMLLGLTDPRTRPSPGLTGPGQASESPPVLEVGPAPKRQSPRTDGNAPTARWRPVTEGNAANGSGAAVQ